MAQAQEFLDHAPVPLRWVGPLRISGNVVDEEIKVPLATYESPLWPSVGRGARLSRMVDGGIQATLISQKMTRSVYFKTSDSGTALSVLRKIQADVPALEEVVRSHSRFAKLTDVHPEISGRLLFLRFEFETGDASGHNMATLSSQHLMEYLLAQHPELDYGSISANMCTDKKTSAVNGILGRGKHVVTEIRLPREMVKKWLRSTPEAIAELNLHKNLIGGTLAGSLRSANAHYANMLLAFYLATGQDAANIVEGSQGITQAEVLDGDLYFSCSLPHLIVGSVGNGKGLDFVEQNLGAMGCLDERSPGENAARLAVLCAATVLCGELSLMAAQTNPGELMSAHIRYERKAR